MDGVVLLSEINPHSAFTQPDPRLDPAFQAYKWFGLLTKEEFHSMWRQEHRDFKAVIRLIDEHCRQANKLLVIRDWSHVDFMGAPILDKPTYKLSLHESLCDEFEIISLATVRHPVDQWFSLRERFEAIADKITLSGYLKGYRKFTETCQQLGFVKYEDFVRSPELALKEICEKLELPYDPNWRIRWADYTKITGGNTSVVENEIRSRRNNQYDPVTLEEFALFSDYRASLALLSYEHPDPARPVGEREGR